MYLDWECPTSEITRLKGLLHMSSDILSSSYQGICVRLCQSEDRGLGDYQHFLTTQQRELICQAWFKMKWYHWSSSLFLVMFPHSHKSHSVKARSPRCYMCTMWKALFQEFLFYFIHENLVSVYNCRVDKEIREKLCVYICVCRDRGKDRGRGNVCQANNLLQNWPLSW